MTNSAPLPAFIEDFITSQIEKWPLAHANFEALKQVRRKPFKVGGLEGYVQFNPARAVSSLAKVDAGSISRRKCFLCAENRPVEQSSLEILPGWSVLMNPFPILEKHLTIAGQEHLPQEYLPEVASELARRLPGMVIFYNADGAGASAPDHRHFQAVPFGTLPLVNLIDENFSNLEEISSQLPFHIVLEASEEGKDNKPLNAFFWMAPDGTVRHFLILRKAHRPDLFFLDPPRRRAFSPGAIDMAGILVTPFEEDFEAVSEEDIRNIYSQVAF